MFLKFWINFSIYSEVGANLKKMEKVRRFVSDYTSFLKILCIFEKFLEEKEKEKKNIYILRQSYNGPTRPLKISSVCL